MTLLKNDKSISPRKIAVYQWPDQRTPAGIGLSMKDGWYAGIGFGLAMMIAVPAILLVFACIIGIGLSMVGVSLGALL